MINGYLTSNWAVSHANPDLATTARTLRSVTMSPVTLLSVQDTFLISLGHASALLYRHELIQVQQL